VPWTLQSGVDGAQDQTLLVEGENLWRNPAVFVDSQQADAVDTLPDMKGVVAHFKHKLSPVTAADNGASLTVVTSIASDSLPQAVTVLPPPQSQAAAPAAALVTAYVVGGVAAQPLAFTVDPKNIPASFADYSLTVRPAAGTEQTVIDTATAKLSADGKTISFPIPAAIKGTANAPALLAVDFRQRLNPFGDPVNLLAKTDPGDRTVVYFTKADQEKPKLDASVAVSVDKASSVCTPASIFLKPAADAKRADVYLAFPGLQTSVAKKTATLSLKQAGKDPVELPLSEEAGTDNFAVALNPKPASLVDGPYTILVIHYVNRAGAAASLDIANGGGANAVNVTTK
jgi:hypothetical protein